MKEVFCFVLYLECLARVFPAEVTLKHGKLTGKSRNIDGTQLFEFLGIPYAKAPTGDLRNLPPVSVSRKSNSKCNPTLIFSDGLPTKVYTRILVDWYYRS